MDSVFENALYRIFSESLVFTTVHTYSVYNEEIPESFKNKKNITEVESVNHVKISLINNLTVWYGKTPKGKTQARYSYRLHTDFRTVLNGYYQVVQKTLITELSKKISMDYPFFYLKIIIQTFPFRKRLHCAQWIQFVNILKQIF